MIMIMLWRAPLTSQPLRNRLLGWQGSSPFDVHGVECRTAAAWTSMDALHVEIVDQKGR